MIAMQPPGNWQQPTEGGFETAMITADIELGNQKLRVFSTLSRFGTALDVGLEELVIESYFPADGTTRAFFMALEADRG